MKLEQHSLGNRFYLKIKISHVCQWLVLICEQSGATSTLFLRERERKSNVMYLNIRIYDNRSVRIKIQDSECLIRNQL